MWRFRWVSISCSSLAVDPVFYRVMGSAPAHTWSLVRQGKEWLAVFWFVWFLWSQGVPPGQGLSLHFVSPDLAPGKCSEMDWVTDLVPQLKTSVFRRNWEFLLCRSSTWDSPQWLELLPLEYVSGQQTQHRAYAIGAEQRMAEYAVVFQKEKTTLWVRSSPWLSTRFLWVWKRH